MVNIPANPNALKKSIEAQEEEMAELRRMDDVGEVSKDDMETMALAVEVERQLTIAEAALL